MSFDLSLRLNEYKLSASGTAAGKLFHTTTSGYYQYYHWLSIPGISPTTVH